MIFPCSEQLLEEFLGIEGQYRPQGPGTAIWWSIPNDTFNPRLYDFHVYIQPYPVLYDPSPKGEGFTDPL